MSKTLEVLRADLARSVGLYFYGVATGGTTGTIVDTNGLAKFVEDDVFNGALTYILTTTDTLAPQGEDRFITDHVAATKTLTVLPAFSVAPAAGDVYEIFKAPLQLFDWNLAINLAIDGAWPEVWRPEVCELTLATDADSQDMTTPSADFYGVQSIWVQQPQVSGRWGILPRNAWIVDAPNKTIYFTTKLAAGTKLRVLAKDRYPQLAATEATDVDYEYLMAASRYQLYSQLTDNMGGQAYAEQYVQLMAHWQAKAQERKNALAKELEGLPLGIGR
jgi:hypothetical protein